MPKKPTNSPTSVSIDHSDDRGEFIRQTAVQLLVTLVATNGKVNSDQPKAVVDVATELADRLKL